MKLTKEYEPRQEVRTTQILKQLMMPMWTEGKDFLSQLLQWEQAVSDYELETSTVIADNVRCAIVAKYALHQVKQYLKFSDVDYSASYERLKTAIVLWHQRTSCM